MKEKDELSTLMANYQALEESKDALDKFESQSCKLVEETLSKLRKQIEFNIKQVEEKTGYDWSHYLTDFDIYDWEQGGFYEEIATSLKAEIRREIDEDKE